MTEYDAFARFYDLEYRDFTDDLDFYRAMAQRAGSPILELACGTGRVVIHLARAGFSVTGVDLSAPMLSIARRRVNAEPADVQQRITLVHADMRSFRLPGRFRMAFYAINSFMHLMTPSDQVRSLKCVRRHLEQDGILVIDIFNPDLALYDSAGRMFYERTMHDDTTHSSVTKLVTTAIDRARQVNRLTFCYDETTSHGTVQRTIAPISQRYLYRHEMEHLLERCGFALEQVYGNFRMDPASASTAKMIFVARRVPGPSPRVTARLREVGKEEVGEGAQPC